MAFPFELRNPANYTMEAAFLPAAAADAINLWQVPIILLFAVLGRAKERGFQQKAAKNFRWAVPFL